METNISLLGHPTYHTCLRSGMRFLMLKMQLSPGLQRPVKILLSPTTLTISKLYGEVAFTSSTSFSLSICSDLFDCNMSLDP